MQSPPDLGILGDTIEDIAGEKAGIAKPHVPLVTMRYAPVVAAKVMAVARSAGAPVAPDGGHWFWSVDGDQLTYRDAAGRVTTPLPALAGAHQPGNLALAVAMLRHQNVLTIPPEAYAAAAREARWPARMQRLGDGPLTRLLRTGSELWVDGGHNAAAGEAIAATLTTTSSGWSLIVGMLASKDPRGLLAPLAPFVKRLIAVPVPDHDHHTPQELVAIAASLDVTASTAGDVPTALGDLAADNPGNVLILGSLYLAGEVLRANDEPPD